MAGGGERVSEGTVSTPGWQALVIKIRSLISAGQRLLPNYRKMGQAKFTAENARARIDTLDAIWAQCQAMHLEVEVQVPESERLECSYLRDEEFADAETEYWTAKDFLLEVIQTLRGPPADGATTSAATPGPGAAKSRARLPRLDLPRFSGEYQEWQAFRDLFTSLVIKDAALDDVERLQYLKTSLEGPALNVVAHYTTTDSNFVTAWAALSRRYENKRALVAAHVRAFITMPPMSNDSAAEIARVCDATNRSLSLLANLGCPTTQWDALVVGAVCLKLESRLLEEWEKSLGTRTDPPTYDELDRFLESRIRSREATQANEEAKARARDAEPQAGKSAPSSTARVCTTHAAHEPPRSWRKALCPVCLARHAAYRCPAFRLMRPDERRDLVSSQRLCVNCLAADHLSPSCPVTASCQRCGRRHHSLLHWVSAVDKMGAAPCRAPVTPTSTTAGGVGPSATAPGVFAAPGPAVSEPVLLATALVRARSAGGDVITLRALLDQGAQTSLISESVVRALRLRSWPVRTYLTGALDGSLGTSRAQVQLTLSPDKEGPPGVPITANVVPRVSSYLPDWTPSAKLQEQFAGLALADPQPYTRQPVDLIVGADHFGALLRPGLRHGTPPALIAQETTLGWIISGPTGRTSSASTVPHATACA